MGYMSSSHCLAFAFSIHGFFSKILFSCRIRFFFPKKNTIAPPNIYHVGVSEEERENLLNEAEISGARHDDFRRPRTQRRTCWPPGIVIIRESFETKQKTPPGSWLGALGPRQITRRITKKPSENARYAHDPEAPLRSIRYRSLP